jgi:alkylation response protein AidB-like acyl-CoA dehydrogenase
MDFAWSRDQQAWYQRTFDLVASEVAPLATARGAASFFTREEWRALGHIGLLGSAIPERYGGRGLDHLTAARLVEAFGTACDDNGLVFAASAHLFACALPIAHFGSEALREGLLPRLCSGEWIGANAITEAAAGSDVYSLSALAVRDGSSYVLNGEKSWIANGPAADLILIYAKTEPRHGYLGISAFAVERDRPGITWGEPFEKLGLESVPTASLCLADCRVPATHLLGAAGQGGMIFTRSMQWERSGLFAGFLGLLERQLERVIQFSRERRQFGRRIGKNQAVSHRIADMKLRLEAARLLLYRACWLLDRGSPEANVAVSLAKLAVSEAAVQSSLAAVQLFGGAGYARAAGIERALRDSLAATLASGTSEMQREIVAKELDL